MIDARVNGGLQAAVAPEWDDHHRCGSRSSWRVVRSHPQAELWAQTNLRRQGYTTYLPMCAVRVRDRVTRSMTRIVQRPLFTSYMFLQLGDDEPVFPIRNTFGVAQLLDHHVNADAVAALQAGDAIRATAPAVSALWQPGNAVCVTGGVFRGVPGVIAEIREDVADVSLLMLGQLREVVVPVQYLMARDD